jgi:hypothetical protein
MGLEKGQFLLTSHPAVAVSSSKSHRTGVEKGK